MNRENVEDIYRLSPVQQGMLFHTLYAPGEGVYFEQFNLRFGPGFDPALFERVWQQIVDRNPVLRTSFAWEGLESPVQIVHRKVKLPFEVLDWRAIPGEEQEAKLRDHAAGERRQGFDLSKPPLIRFSVFRLRDDLHHVVLSYHHAVLDGWSAGLLIQEVSSLYPSAMAAMPAIAGRPILAQPRRPFRDYIAWLRQQGLSQAEAYWRRVLGGFTSPTPLGIDRPAGRNRRPEENDRAMKAVLLTEEETEILKAWARTNRLTLSTAVQGAWALVLSRYSGEDDVVFGATVSGRPPSLPGVDAMLGCFINTLPVRVSVPGGESVLSWLNALQADQAEMRRHEHSPLVQVLGWSDVPRPTPLFESLFVFEGFTSTLRESVFQRTGYPLTLVAGADREMVLRIDYELERFEPAAVERLLGHLKTALSAFVADPGQRLEDVQILTPEERPRPVLAAAQPTFCLHRAFEAQAERCPEAPAVTFEGTPLSYRELNERANRLAHHLRRLGVGPETRVGLCLERSFEMIVGVLGILKAGGAYVPLDPRYPASRLAFIAEDSGMDVLVTAEPLRGLVQGPAAVVCLDTADLGSEIDGNPESGAEPENLAYVIYTSGSTGRPKGSLVTHANVARLFTATDPWFHFGPEDVWTLFHSFAFDFSVWEIWGALLYGGRLVVVPYWVSRSPEAFHELLVRERVTVLNQTPSAFRQLVQADLQATAVGLALRFVVFGGEALELSSLAPWFDRHGDRRPLLVNMYGITETTVHVTWRPVAREDLAEAGRSPVGVPIPDLAVHLRDRHGNLVPVGVAGEMFVAGAGVARGYLGRPDLTAERFVPDPFGVPGERLYRSGDLARRLPDGGLEYLGRIDHQVKIRGFRIELGEIEAAILAHPGVRETVVLVREGAQEDRRLVAYVVPRDGEIDVSSLRSSLKERLPEYMVPAAFVELGSLPLTAHGKVDRRALPDPAESQAAVEGVTSEPRTPTEEIVAGLWTEILGVERIGRGDNFFDLGGHSLMATRLLSRIREAFQADLPLRALFDAPVLSQLAQEVDAERARARQMEVPPLVAVPRESHPPLSFGQERLWFLEQLSPGSATYNVPAALRLRGPLNVPALLGALRAAVDRHESLRTTFGTAAGRPVQVIAPSLDVQVPLIDLGALPEAEREAAALALARAETRTPFRLDRGPLVRSLLLRLGGEDHVLVLTVHHIVSDEWSMNVLTGELAALYSGVAVSQLPPLPVQYADYAQWLRGWLQGEVLERELAWWRQALAGAPTVLDLPTDRPRPAVQSFRGTRQTVEWPGGLLPAIIAYSRSQGATVFMTLLAAFQALLGRYTGQSDLLVGSTIAGRSRIELEGLIGFFVNSLVLRGTLDWSAGFRDLLAQVRERTLGAYAHQDLPFERIVEELQPQRDLSRSPLFQVVFQLQNAAAGRAPEIPGLAVSPLAAGSETAKLDLVLTLAESEQGLAGNWSYSTDLFDAATVRRLTDHLRTLLEGALADPRRRLGELPLLCVPERQQLLTEAEAGVEVEEGPCLHQLFTAQALRSPESTAVSFEGEALTYAELERRTNQLARHLRRLGVVRGSRVGLSVERSLATVAGVLGILKAGAAYVPLDPTYPKDRLDFALADSGVRILLTEERLAADRDRIEEESGEPFESGATGADVAYVIYTSGSTGRPKGVLVRHFNAVRLFTATEEWFRFGPSDVWTLFHSIAFDFSVWELWGALLYGGRLVVVPFRVSRSPGEFHDLLRRERVTVLNQTPSAFRQLIRADEAAGEERLAGLRWVVFGGEALELASLSPWFERYGDERPRLVNMYGITETTVHVTWRPLFKEDLAAGSVIGRPIPDLSLTLVDARMEPVPIGVPGEILVGGSGLAVGYLGRPDLTAERFVPDPFGRRPGARLYRSGDLARRLANGDVEYLGRIDHQVKIRGFRIELGEIESALARHPAVREAVVLVREARQDRRLVAYVVTRGEAGDLTLGAVRDFLARTLPDYMLPAALVVLPALPLTPNGKVDRRALPEPEAERAQVSAGYVAPRNAEERFLAGLWSEVLGVERIGIHDNFFELGGNSILGAVLINRLQEELGEIIHVVAIFDAPTIAGLAELLRGSSSPAAARRIGEAEVAEIRSLIQPLSPLTSTEPRNPPAVFVLAPPRSGTTLLRVMLGGHPRLFSPPELELLTFRTLAERRAAFQGRDSFWLEGLIRAVMEIRGCGPDEARETVEACERDGWTSQRFYRQMQEWLGDRRLVDKTPSYTLSPPVLERAEAEFEEPLYLHLVRHPYGMIASFEEAKLDQIFFRYEHPFSRRELAELIWLVSQRNILDFLRRVPAGRQLQVRFEDLVREPAAVMERVCAFLGIDLHPDMVLPYKNERARMTDGLHAESRMLGDVKFHQHKGVEASVAERWRETYAEDFLGGATWDMAARLGYDVEKEVEKEGGWKAGEPLPLSFAQERLWFLDQLDPGTRTYNVSTAVRLLGRLDAPALGGSLNEIARRHASLRTTFTSAQGSPAQAVAPELRLAMPVVDLSGLPEPLREREARAVLTRHAGEPFDLTRGALLRALLLRLGAEDHAASFVAHHIVCDGWSIGVLVRELAALYTAAVEGEASPLPELRVQYVDFAAWQRRWLAGSVLEDQLAYWRERLDRVPVLQLPADRPRPGVQSFDGSTHGFTLPAGLSEALRTLSRERGVTVFMAVLAAFQALLARLSGQRDFAVGSPVAGRNRRDLEPLIGFFVNTLVFRASLSGDPGYGELLDRVRQVALGAYAHQDVPFEKVVQELAPERNLSYTPLFQVMLAFQNAPAGRLDLPGLTLAPMAEDFTTSKFDLSLTVFDQGPEIFGQWVYSVALFDGETIARWAGNLQTLLEGLLAEPERPLSELSLLTQEERRQILVDWNRPPADYPDEGFVHRLFEEQAARRPEAVAAAFEGETLTYGELNARANRLAHRLRRLGVGPDVLVGVRAGRSFEMIAGLLAILKAGGAYLPLDPALPEERLRFMIEDAGISPGLGLVLDEDRLREDVSPESAENPEAVLHPDHLAYVIYTSGSTGQPKGVMISHRALGNRLQYARAGDVTADDAFLQKTTISFDVSVLEIFAPLVAGGRTVLARPGGQQDPAYLVQYIREQGITYTSFPPSLLYVLFEQPGFDQCHSLRIVITGGETVPPVLPGELYERLPGADLLNRYGPTEATISVTSWRCERGAVPRTLPIGRPTAKARVYLVDRNLQPVPVGVPGELHLGGLCLARGYLNRPDLTAEKFIPDPFSGEIGARLYRTGDLARYRPDGAIEFVGRVDSQVKIRGFRVELGEIEAALARHPAVREVAVVDREDGPSRSLAAYVVPQPGETPGDIDEAELRRFLGETLPAYMVPSDFVSLDAFPLAPTGKVDRQALPAPDRRGVRGVRGVPGEIEPPRNPTEELLAAIWADLLSLEQAGIHDGFFELGGHSLLATQAMSRVREAFGVDLPLRLLFERPTVAALAEEVDAAVRAGAGLEAPPLVPLPRDEDPPLSFAQERLWFLDRLQPGSSTYNLPLVVRLHGPLSVPAFAASLREVVRRHESLRTTFAVRGGRPVQVIAPEPALPVPLLDLERLPGEARDAEALRIAQEVGRRPFDLEAGPLVRAVLMRLGNGEHMAAVAMHHIVSDGWSIGILIREVAALYGAALSGRPSPLPELPVQYADFARWQRDWLRGEALAAQLSYWRQRLAGVPPLLELPTDRPRPAVQRFRGRNHQQVLPRDLSRELKTFCRQAGSTPFMVLLAGFQALIHRYTGRRDVVVGSPVAGRDRLETEGLIGFFLNSLVMRTGLDGDPGFRILLERVRETALGAYAHQNLPFEKLVEELAPERNLSHAPLFQVMLVFQNTPRTLPEPHGVTFSPVELDTDTAKFDLTLNARESARESEGGLVVVWLYNRDLFDAATVDRFAGHLETLLTAAVAQPERPLSELPLLTPAEEREIVDWNGTAVPYPTAVCLHELIEAQVERDPDRVAVVFEGASLTYGELNAAANGLVRRLMGMGAGPEVPVGVFAERSLEMVVALFAILKAGAAYLPLDPDYPEDRIAYMLESSRVPVLLTQPRLAGRLPETGARVVLLDIKNMEMEEGNPTTGVQPGNLAYVIYTSGSTGRPKGVMNTHRGIVNRLLWMQGEYGLTPEDRVLQKTPFSFDVSVWEFFWPLMTGARLVMARPGGHQDAAYLARTIQAEGITTLHFVPSMLQVFLEAPGVEGCVSLLRVIASGEALPYELQRRFFRRLSPGGAGLHNLYGPTEAAVDVTYWPCEAEGKRGVVPIGWPVANTRIHLLDAHLRPVPVGVPGELHIGGVQVARGYLGRPELTAEHFIPDAFSTGPGARLYKTGDLARYLPGGAVDFLGRIDHQVKLRGLRIELGEIEAALAAHPAVREAVVLTRAEGAGTLGAVNLVAYLTRSGMEEPEPAALRALLARSLPDYMIPAAWVVLDELPLSPNGKVDRKALSRIAPERTAGAPVEKVAPRTEMERALAALWSEVLIGSKDFGIHDNFFDLGGNSITGALLINRLQQTLGEIVHVVAIFDSPTIATLAASLARDYPEAVARIWGPESLGEAGAAGTAQASRPLDETRLSEVRGLIRTLPPARLPARRNPPVLFVLSPPRSGSTLLRVMLGGHPGLFAPPELELLNFNTLAERRAAFQGRDSFRLEGLLRAVMEIRGQGPDDARALVEGFAAEGLTTQEVYGRLQKWIAPRLLVDKTPTYAWDPATLRRAEEAFHEPRYLHLIRHPYGMIRSFEEARIDQIFFPESFPDGRPFSRRELAEALWTIAHRNVLDFLAEVPEERQHTVRFEDLLRDPEDVLLRICAFLGIEYHPDMAEPYKKKSERMTDGLHAESRMLGDVKFHQHKTVDRNVAEGWRRHYTRDFLGGATWRLAARLGYGVETGRVGAASLPPALVKLRPGTAQRPLYLVHPLSGELLLYRHLIQGLAPDQAVYGFQARGFQEGEQPLERIEDMADLYVQSLLAFQPEGPYLLAGSSMGGLIAFEMARRLQDLGKDVALTALLDAPPPGRAAKDGPGEAEMDLLRYATGGRASLSLDDLLKLAPDQRLERILEAGREAGGLPPGMGLPELRRLVALLEANRRALRRYGPEPAGLRATYVRAAEGVRADAAWKPLALSGLEVHEVTGNHLSMHFPPHVHALAAQLAACIERTAGEMAERGAWGYGIGTEALGGA